MFHTKKANPQKVACPQNKTFIKGAGSSVSYKLRDKTPQAGEGGILLLRNGKFVMWKLKSPHLSYMEV